MPWKGDKYTVVGILDMSDECPSLLGDAILLRDDDGIGFAFAQDVDRLVGKFVRITIEEEP